MRSRSVNAGNPRRPHFPGVALPPSGSSSGGDHSTEGGGSKSVRSRNRRHSHTRTDQAAKLAIACHHEPNQRYSAPATGKHQSPTKTAIRTRNTTKMNGRYTTERHVTAQRPRRPAWLSGLMLRFFPSRSFTGRPVCIPGSLSPPAISPSGWRIASRNRATGSVSLACAMRRNGMRTLRAAFANALRPTVLLRASPTTG